MALRSTLLASAFILACTTPALAAPAPACVPASMMPRATSVPANLPAFGYDALKAEAKDVKLTNTTTQATIPLTVGPVEGNLIKVAPTTPLVPGATYQLTYASFCQYGGVPEGKPITFTVAPSAPVPTRIGDADPNPAVVTVKDYGSSKLTIVKSFKLAPEMQPWINVYELALLLDGRAVETKASVSGDSMQITATGWCDAKNGATNTHTMQLRAKLPFSPTLLEKELSQDFACPAPKITTAPPANPAAPTTPPSLPPGSTTSTNPSTSNDSSGVSTCSMAAPRVAATPFAVVALGLSLLSFRRRARK